MIDAETSAESKIRRRPRICAQHEVGVRLLRVNVLILKAALREVSATAVVLKSRHPPAGYAEVPALVKDVRASATGGGEPAR